MNIISKFFSSKINERSERIEARIQRKSGNTRKDVATNYRAVHNTLAGGGKPSPITPYSEIVAEHEARKEGDM